ncbi:glycerol-3-phosphate dehydrogenase [Sphingosinicella sp. LY1275]|uniref:glycerol-3-phosphate dehydrogenase n=1 Tax=Sphingosinicella sp. LY1275 TaxID=3095379 RepID=UPI002ADEAC56|nr:glycerol-3-phosphate dehydrogenase [Sphingosinicella sp. LY1275]MEA1014727.1 glycerol-3-phosphate dehydrogenase [Sphingosinicella sp. LY1275]
MESFDLLVVGGGINGTAIARDAAGHGQKVLLVEKDDLGQHTSSASSKLIHGGLRYLEYYEFRLVREALQEREIMLRTAPHIVRPLRFVLPHTEGMRPWWMVRAGLKLYDLLAWGSSLPGSHKVKPRGSETLISPLKRAAARRMAIYWDAWVDDSRLVVLNAVDAAERGAEIATRTEMLSARREGDLWQAELSGGRRVAAKAIVNAAGPWVAEVLNKRLCETSTSRVRLIKGSHIAVPRLYEGDHAYILQQPDGRVVFALPFDGCTLIGTTDVPVSTPEEAVIDAGEIAYLCAAANLYFEAQVGPADVRWTYSGVRSLYDDGAAEAKAVTRDYRLELDDDPGAKLLSVFGGKITTARALAAEALDRLGIEGRKWTTHTALPGGDIYPAFNDYLDRLRSWMPAPMVTRLARAYGTRLKDVLGEATGLDDLGRRFTRGLYECEVRYLVDREFVRTAEDILWRRTKTGLIASDDETAALAAYLA